MAGSREFKKIVVGVDGSEESVEALRQAQTLAEPLGAQLEAVTCWEFPQLYDGYVTMQAEDFRDSAGKVQEDTLSRAFGSEIPRNLVARLAQGNPKSELADASRHADQLILGRRGHGALAGQLFGSVSSSLVARSACPVLVVHRPEPDGGD